MISPLSPPTFPLSFFHTLCILPHSLHSSNNSINNKFIAIFVSVSILSAAFVTALILFFFLYHRHPHPKDKNYDIDNERSDSLRLVSPNTTPSNIEIGRANKKKSSFVSCREVNEDVAQSSTAPNDSSTMSKFGNSSGRYVPIKLSPPPPPPPPLPPRPRFWESSTVLKPRVVVENGGPQKTVSWKSANGICESWEGVERRNEESMKPKLKPLHWDKVRASSDRAMVWD
ncbi:hypothetical protein RND71_035493 [Anisodus tanguticus]|uniref:FH2 domain-containing protein n=1 Tax=Anisodus tanguticus TaxID=243964 RepID=A0AAE1R7R3_9SOLA|nr:hypothetical protein RND71_035493 [Anisodus tanguticus]